MAISYFHTAGQDADWHTPDVSTEVPKNGFCIPVPVDGSRILLDARFWSFFNTGKNAVGTNNEDCFIRTSDAEPQLSYAASNAAQRETIPLGVNRERILRQADVSRQGSNLTRDQFIVALKPASAALTILVTPNEVPAR